MSSSAEKPSINKQANPELDAAISRFSGPSFRDEITQLFGAAKDAAILARDLRETPIQNLIEVHICTGISDFGENAKRVDSSRISEVRDRISAQAVRMNALVSALHDSKIDSIVVEGDAILIQALDQIDSFLENTSQTVSAATALRNSTQIQQN